MDARLIQFLQEELAIPAAAIAVAQRHQDITPNLLPIILWQYGLVTLDDLNRIFDWLETA
ncbi:DUF2949 domain-containing protein [Pantanalinema sp. GBBB05]|uniref:DUF2949 domain-containing protein n=1 Tax=Pantanalinema sp. GBBB05 TaxID=2604139 RepID=UPI001DF78428|nr:DUF2949 domain-containing protein [Pantanalinema sp. GBBB05]